MSLPTPTIPDTNPGTSNSSSNETTQVSGKKKPAISRLDLAEFFDAIHNAKYACEPGEAPVVETSRKIIDHFNAGRAQEGFNRAGYFVYDGVRVCEHGKTEEVLMRESRDTIVLNR